jgi:chaperone BCS1
MNELNELIKPLLSNPVFAGISGATVMAGIMYWLRSVPMLLWRLLQYAFTVRFQVTQGDIAFEWMDRWLSQHPSSHNSNSLKLMAQGYDDDTTWFLTAGYGKRLIWVNGRPFIFNRFITERSAGSGLPQSQQENISMATIGRSQAPIRRIIAEAHGGEVERKSVTVRVWGDFWYQVRGKRARGLDSIVLKDGQMERIMADFQWFLGAGQWYVDRGIPYRRGYLFSGPPGTGKTSLVLAIASHLKRPVCMLNLGSVKSDDALFRALLDAPVNGIILIEDIDCATSSVSRSSEKEHEGENRLTMAGLLNALDGVLTPDGRIIIMTTNHPDKLDPAIIRPGRADVHEAFEYLGASEQKKLAAKFYAEPFEPICVPMSPAVMQSAFMKFPASIHDARAALNAKQAPRICRWEVIG